ncbi:MAG: signal peptidase I [Candidatus Zambryskibacteria bacterium RIFCSPLOWO2_01_FULL_39_39]|uniref:Signal peptidase I n=1 Tax=Candidatus Zambryskibacteria bacterium RIFCSPLOWO2_01_FULL_39_39 TaxID=1802758 RepID=A0A1G2TZF8_9BACT|nr:MAG: Signal peptidase I [Parcubacteria group bacterium GW2011_GWA1_38_7]OHA87177.1 MAG: signal peptidase I [Candidatus Zambryskibacteria bacterium RIFCSPHIGHO2_01_FULL_39_63]OHA94815.1 MAG: signal peptidase I [Candidatus Zambryskibacteria bacterium RIFCSPHIGHO2_02_FULL_39_19]OHA98305.1 MAG: signal peptidase I [Candidatus Zambryskibacteria bacterium RIFCSPHIGHO2_12_FULL_39_21]OHB02691.1 MAG: signal peptidase I [Candidatus Zambryskibacteria bacterium RIFCSPLOWO2_01_FULL_39_39]
MEENNNPKNGSSLWEFIRYAIIALLIVVPFRIFIAQPYVVSGSSMDPTFKDADYLIVDQISKRFEEPERGSVIIIRYPKDPSKFFIKRLIGFPGETVEIKKGRVYIENVSKESASNETFLLDEPYVTYSKQEDFSAKLGEDEYFVMGDNRAGSSDSRIWGTLPKKYIIGRPIVRLLPLGKISVWPGLY